MRQRIGTLRFKLPRRALLGAIVVLLALAAPAPWRGTARAERWLCPDCPDEIVDRPAGSPTLVCPKCGKTYTHDDLSPALAYINSRTQNVEIAWVAQADTCSMFNRDGLQAESGSDTVWVPWTAIDWYIPRMETLRLKNGKEMTTDYPKNPLCNNPPHFVFEVVDSTGTPGQKPVAYTERREETLAELFIVATSPEARDSARVRFIAEVEGGKRPRLPRTQPKLLSPRPVFLPDEAKGKGFKGELVADVRVHPSRGAELVRVISGTGNAAVDNAVLTAVRYSAYLTGGEMGVAVPAWLRVRVTVNGDSTHMTTETPPHSFWRE